MNILLLLVPLSVVLLVAMVGAFIWAVRDGQFEDMDAAPLDVLREFEPGDER
jgi:cbb3-type cytochrome oxidase maturation protein